MRSNSKQLSIKLINSIVVDAYTNVLKHGDVVMMQYKDAQTNKVEKGLFAFVQAPDNEPRLIKQITNDGQFMMIPLTRLKLDITRYLVDGTFSPAIIGATKQHNLFACSLCGDISDLSKAYGTADLDIIKGSKCCKQCYDEYVVPTMMGVPQEQVGQGRKPIQNYIIKDGKAVRVNFEQ